jgi:hypothetical protein
MGHEIVPQSAKWPVFGWLMVAFFSGTLFFVLFLQTIIGRLRRVEDAMKMLYEKSKDVIFMQEDALLSLPQNQTTEDRGRYWSVADIAQRLRRRRPESRARDPEQ